MDRDGVLDQIKVFLHDNFQMSLATCGEEPWIATVYYSVDEELNLYFLSNPKTIHCQQIATNPKVAVSIAASPQVPDSNKTGLQLYGLAEKVSGRHKITYALSLWNRKLGVTDSNYSYEGMMRKAISGRMYRITPKKIKFFNEELWDEGNEPMIEL